MRGHGGEMVRLSPDQKLEFFWTILAYVADLRGISFRVALCEWPIPGRAQSKQTAASSRRELVASPTPVREGPPSRSAMRPYWQRSALVSRPQGRITQHIVVR